MDISQNKKSFIRVMPGFMILNDRECGDDMTIVDDQIA